MQVIINIDDRYINFFRKAFTRRKAVLALLAAALATNLNADSITKSYNFNAGNTIIASQVNVNFDQLFTKVNELDAKLTPFAGMVAVGDFYVDKYEASVWDSYTTDANGTQYGILSGNYPCSDNGNDCSGIYARSVSGVTPSRYITWFQAQQACLNSGKHLITNAEWQAAAAGTPDPGANSAALFCNTEGSGPTLTGAGTSCLSRWGAENMIGSLWEWTADWFGADSATNALTTNATYGSDSITDVDPADNQGSGSNFPATALRGGSWGTGAGAGVFAMTLTNASSYSADTIGFRCARRR